MIHRNRGTRTDVSSGTSFFMLMLAAGLTAALIGCDRENLVESGKAAQFPAGWTDYPFYFSASNGKLSAFYPLSNRIEAIPIDVPNGVQVEISARGDKGYVVTSGYDSIAVVSLANGEVETWLEFEVEPIWLTGFSGIVPSPDGTKLAIRNGYDLTILRTIDFQEIYSMSGCRGRSEFSLDGNRYYCFDMNIFESIVIDSLNAVPSAVVLDAVVPLTGAAMETPDGRYLLSARAMMGSEFTVYERQSWSIAAERTQSFAEQALATITPDGKYAFCTSPSSGSVTHGAGSPIVMVLNLETLQFDTLVNTCAISFTDSTDHSCWQLRQVISSPDGSYTLILPGTSWTAHDPMLVVSNVTLEIVGIVGDVPSNWYSAAKMTN